MGRWLLALADLIDEPLTIIIFRGRGRDQELPFGPGPWCRSLALEPLTLMVLLFLFPGGGGKDQQLPFLVLGFGTLDSYSVFVMSRAAP